MLEHDIEHYYQLKRGLDLAQARLKTLRERIIQNLPPIPEQGGSQEHIIGGYRVTEQVRRRTPKIEEHQLEQLIVDKNLAADCMRLRVDHDLVEQAFIEGKITDQDLRSINGGSDITIALLVDKIEDGV